MFKPSKKDLRFLYWAATITLVIMALMHLVHAWMESRFEPIPQGEVTPAHMEQVQKSIVKMGALDVPTLLTNAQAKPTLLYIYASWCGYCRRMMPGLIDLKQGGELDAVETVFLSWDRNEEALARYIIAYEYEGLYTHYWIIGRIKALTNVIAKRGGHFNGSLPYTAVLSPEGRIIAEQMGGIGRSDILAMVKFATQ